MIKVGPAYNCVCNPKWRYAFAAHLFCDSEEELQDLHEFAQSIGLKRAWFQSHPTLPHYDLTKRKREQALQAGAASVTQKHEVAVLRAWRAKQQSKQK